MKPSPQLVDHEYCCNGQFNDQVDCTDCEIGFYHNPSKMGIEKPPARAVGGLVDINSGATFVATKSMRGSSVAYRVKLTSFAFGACDLLPALQIF